MDDTHLINEYEQQLAHADELITTLIEENERLKYERQSRRPVCYHSPVPLTA